MEALKNLVGGTPDEETAHHRRCEDMREKALDKCARSLARCSVIGLCVWNALTCAPCAWWPGPRVKFLVDAMKKMGCKPQPGFYSSVDCEGAINGGFQIDDDGKPGVRELQFLRVLSTWS